MRRVGSFGTCSKCGERILWIKTTSGKNMPCNPTFVYYKEKEGGKDRIVLPNGQIVAGEIQKQAEYADGFGYVSHVAMCEYSNMFRRKEKHAAIG